MKRVCVVRNNLFMIRSRTYDKMLTQTSVSHVQMWKDWVEVKEVEEVEEKEREVKYKEVVVTEVVDPAHVWVQPFEKSGEVDALGERLNAQLNANANPYEAKVGEMCAAKFSDDGVWYRAKLQRINKDKSVTVLFVDYGNSETVAPADLAALPADCVTPAPVVYDVRMACIKVPADVCARVTPLLLVF